MGKMTDEALETVLFKAETNWSIHGARAIRAHIAALTAELREANNTVRAARAAQDALTAERDESMRQVDAAQRFAASRQNEVNALRERVKALEERAEQHRRGAQPLIQREHDAVARLAAIRKRAGDTQELENIAIRVGNSENWGRKHVTLAVARYILGDDAPAPSEPLHCCGTTTEQHRKGCPTVGALAPLGIAPPSELAGMQGEMADAPVEDEDGPLSAEDEALIERGRQRLCASPAEPTTAEALGHLRLLAATLPSSARDEAECALSLLERRMGATERALRGAPDWDKRYLTPTEHRDLMAALTDAPPVFTMEEVGTICDDVYSDCDGDSGFKMLEEVKRRLAALRRKP